MLTELFCTNSIVKVFDFLLENRFWEYTKKDIAENSGISRVQIHRLWPVLEKYGIIKETRRLGATSLYITNLESPIVRRLGSLSLEIAKVTNRLVLKKELDGMKKEKQTRPRQTLRTRSGR